MADPLREQFDQTYALANKYFGDVIDISPPTPPDPAELAGRYKTLGSGFLAAYDLEVGKLIDSDGRYPFNRELWQTYGRIAVTSANIGKSLDPFQQTGAEAMADHFWSQQIEKEIENAWEELCIERKTQQARLASLTRAEIALWKQEEYIYEKRERVQNRLKGLADFFKNYIGQYLTYDDILPVLTESIDPQKPDSARTFAYTALSDNLLGPFFEAEGLVLQRGRYQINGKGQRTAVFVCLEEGEEPKWPQTAVAEPIKSNPQSVPQNVRTQSKKGNSDLLSVLEESVEALEEKLRHPPPHEEIIRTLRKAGWFG